MKHRQLDHVAIHVADVPHSVDFYARALQLEPIPRPAFDFPGAWFRIGSAQELHLIGGRTEESRSHHRGTHFAILVDSLDDWERHLRSVDVPFRPRKQRPDGAHQIFLKDPDGHCIELCEPVER